MKLQISQALTKELGDKPANRMHLQVSGAGAAGMPNLAGDWLRTGLQHIMPQEGTRSLPAAGVAGQVKLT